MNKYPLYTAVSGLVTFLLGIILSVYIFPKIINSQMHKNLDLKEGTQAYDAWKEAPFPIKFKIYFFNVSNTAEVEQGGYPIVKEVGPYVYDQYRVREEIAPDETRDTLRYMLKKVFYFNQTDSGSYREDDVLTLVNAALVGTALQVEGMMPSALPMIADAIPYLYKDAKGIFLHVKVSDMLFNGIRLYCQDDEVEFICGAMKGMLPKTIRVAENGVDFLFSMFGHLNGTQVGPWEMGRGFKNTTRGDIYSFQEEEQLTIWADEYCNSINGSDSSTFEIMKNKKRERIYSFSEDLCRSFYINYDGPIEQFGIKALKYSSKASSIAKNADNRCFCPMKMDEQGNQVPNCPPSGLVDITACMKAPVLVSYPHFYLGDKNLLKFVTGLNPDRKKHENFVYLEPKTATPIQGARRIQINVEMKKMESFPLLANVSEFYFPVLWIEEGMTLPDEYVDLLSSNLSKLSLVNGLKWLVTMIGVLLLMGGGVMALKNEKLLCFANNDTVDITLTKQAPRLNAGEVNAGYESNPSLYPQLDNKPTNNNFANRPRANQPNSQAWQQN